MVAWVSETYFESQAWRVAAMFIVASGYGLVAVGQEAKAPAEQFGSTFREWNVLEAELTKRQSEYEAAPAASRGELKKQYEQLVEQSTELLGKLGAAAEAAYAAAPNQDRSVI